MFILNLIIFILVLGIIILIHEFGHFFFAKRAGILCHEFAIGMGPVIYQKRKGETVYSIRSIPIGGFVSMAGESINDALIKIDQVIGVKINGQGQIYQIIMNKEMPSDAIGIVKSYDLYGKDFDPLFINLEIDGILSTYPVLRDAIYVFAQNKEMWITPSEKSFESKTLWQRFLVIFAGPLMNFILAFLLFVFLAFFALKPNMESNEIAEVVNNSPAYFSGLEEGDFITAINGTAINSWNDVSNTMRMLNTGNISVSYMRDNELLISNDVLVSTIIQTVGLTNTQYDKDDNFVALFYNQAIVGTAFGRAKYDGKLETGDLITKLSINTFEYDINNWDDIIQFFQIYNEGNIIVFYERDGLASQASFTMLSESALNKLGYQGMVFQLGVAPTASFDWTYSFEYPFKTFSSNVKQVFATLGLLFDTKEDVGIGDLSGPVGIYSLVKDTAKLGILPLIAFTGFLSINIGLLNLMPIPALDGGRLVFLGIEAVTKKQLNRKIENTINNIMFLLLMGLFVFVTYNDIIRLIKG